MKKVVIATALLLCTGSAMAKGAFDDAADAIDYRQAAFGLIKENFADMGAMLKNKKPMDSQVFAERAEHLAMLAAIPFNGFDVKGSDQGDTGALPAVWSDRGEFNAIADKFQLATKALAKASSSGDSRAIAKAFGGVGKTCKGCHDQFKAD
ncbi:c-type cytochrome [Ferrimonas senticii]|uniref:c-type cytochrome n=1 Tax=Ferrimonas senticii TaxID=394566 RepID=UPI000418F29C|nr:cytochrome c [Ferrimonas senticii]